MSEAEKKKRLDYKRNRQKWIYIISAVTAGILLISLIMSIAYFNTAKNYYINYTENSSVDYKVYLKDNEFFEEEYLDEGHAYIAAFIDKVSADFRYQLNMEEEVVYDYSYKINAILEVTHVSTGKVIYSPKYELVPETVVSLDKAQQKLVIAESVSVNYDEFNEMAENFVVPLGLENVKSAVVLEMEVDVISTCDSFEDEYNKNEYFVSLNVPLSKQLVDIQIESDVPDAETKILACTKGTGKTVFLVLTIIFTTLSALAIAFLVVFIYLTRNTDINYEIKVNKIVSKYRSYIQQIITPFDFDGYHVLSVKTFREMLEIRDTIQSPILMSENEDKTRTDFIIPTNTKLLYIFEVKVEDYDQIYNPEEPIILVDNVDEEALAEAINTPTTELEDINFVDEIDEEVDEGVEVIGVVWPEKATKNKIYRYDPNGETVEDGDIVLVPSRDVAKNKDIIRKATVAHGNHRVDPDTLKHPLKKIIGIVQRRAEAALTPKENTDPEAKKGFKFKKNN
ncbi:MAG: hypothetical protein IKL59_04210 [Clostridia bacterium]|nr:hypothetical protein [Clostridia bacterium]